MKTFVKLEGFMKLGYPKDRKPVDHQTKRNATEVKSLETKMKRVKTDTVRLTTEKQAATSTGMNLSEVLVSSPVAGATTSGVSNVSPAEQLMNENVELWPEMTAAATIPQLEPKKKITVPSKNVAPKPLSGQDIVDSGDAVRESQAAGVEKSVVIDFPSEVLCSVGVAGGT